MSGQQSEKKKKKMKCKVEFKGVLLTCFVLKVCDSEKEIVTLKVFDKS